MRSIKSASLPRLSEHAITQVSQARAEKLRRSCASPCSKTLTKCLSLVCYNQAGHSCGLARTHWTTIKRIHSRLDGAYSLIGKNPKTNGACRAVDQNQNSNSTGAEVVTQWRKATAARRLKFYCWSCWWIHWPNCGGYRSVLIWQKSKSADNSNDDGMQHVVVNAESQSATA